MTRVVTICNKRGLHARAAAKFVTMAERFGASVEVVHSDGQIGLRPLDHGPDDARRRHGRRRSNCAPRAGMRKEALDALAALVEAGFDEPD